MRGSVPLRRLVPFLRCSALPKSVAERQWCAESVEPQMRWISIKWHGSKTTTKQLHQTYGNDWKSWNTGDRDLFPLDPLEVFLCLSEVPDVKVCRDSTNQCQFDESVWKLVIKGTMYRKKMEQRYFSILKYNLHIKSLPPVVACHVLRDFTNFLPAG